MFFADGLPLLIMVAAAIGGLLLTLVLIVIVVTCRSVKPTFSPSILSQSVFQANGPESVHTSCGQTSSTAGPALQLVVAGHQGGHLVHLVCSGRPGRVGQPARVPRQLHRQQPPARWLQGAAAAATAGRGAQPRGRLWPGARLARLRALEAPLHGHLGPVLQEVHGQQQRRLAGWQLSPLWQPVAH